MSEKKQKIIPLSLGVLAMSLAIGYLVFAWTGPSANPPQNNVPAPINVGNTTQTKSGGLNILGNVGIGTTGPGYKLDVAGNLRAQGWTMIGTGDDRLSLELQGTFHRMAFNELRFWDWQTGEMVTFNNGNVGIGTTAPVSRLDVRGSTNIYSGYLAVRNDYGYFHWDAPPYRVRVGEIYGNAGLYTPDANMQFDIGGGGNFIWTFGNSEKMRITSGGNVGIGTTAPGAKLSVIGARQASITPSNAIMQVGGGDVFLYTGALNGGSYAVMMQAMRNWDSTAFPLSLQPNGGNVGIGTTDPGAYKLNVAGPVYIGGNISAPSNTPDACYWTGYGLSVSCNAGFWVVGIGVTCAWGICYIALYCCYL